MKYRQGARVIQTIMNSAVGGWFYPIFYSYRF